MLAGLFIFGSTDHPTPRRGEREHYEFSDVAYKPFKACPVPIVEESQKLLVAGAQRAVVHNTALQFVTNCRSAGLVAAAGKAVTIVDRTAVIEQVGPSRG